MTKKTSKKLLGTVLATFLVLAMSVPAFAAFNWIEHLEVTPEGPFEVRHVIPGFQELDGAEEWVLYLALFSHEPVSREAGGIVGSLVYTFPVGTQFTVIEAVSPPDSHWQNIFDWTSRAGADFGVTLFDARSGDVNTLPSAERIQLGTGRILELTADFAGKTLSFLGGISTIPPSYTELGHPVQFHFMYPDFWEILLRVAGDGAPPAPAPEVTPTPAPAPTPEPATTPAPAPAPVVVPAPAPVPVAPVAPAAVGDFEPGRRTPFAQINPAWFPVGSVQTVDYANALNVRRGPGVSHAAFSHLLRYDQFTVLEYRNGWVRLDTERFGYGWVSAMYLRRP